jgi:hypothetical protein
VNGLWKNQSFHNYADYAMSDDFRRGLQRLIALGRARRCVMMCSEAVWWRCHRRIVADHLIARGETVFHIVDKGRLEPARLTPGAVVQPGGAGGSGLAWAEGTLWVGRHRDRKIHQIDPETGAVLRTIESNRFVTGVTWVEGELWHGTWEGDRSDVRRIDPATGKVLERLELPEGTGVSGLESDGGERLFCGSGDGATVRVIRRPRRD